MFGIVLNRVQCEEKIHLTDFLSLGHNGLLLSLLSSSRV